MNLRKWLQNLAPLSFSLSCWQLFMWLLLVYAHSWNFFYVVSAYISSFLKLFLCGFCLYKLIPETFLCGFCLYKLIPVTFLCGFCLYKLIPETFFNIYIYLFCDEVYFLYLLLSLITLPCGMLQNIHVIFWIISPKKVLSRISM